MSANEAAERLRCEATRPNPISGATAYCRRPRWKGHPTRYCYQHAIAFGDARVVDQAAVDLLLAAERRATVERIREAFHALDTSDPYENDARMIEDGLVDAILDEEAAR